MSSSSPLESTKYYVLLALAAGPQHGYAIREQIVGDTVGVYLRNSTLYSVLKSLVRDGLVEGSLAASHGGPMGGLAADNAPVYRKVHRITEAGKRRLELESRTFRRAAQLAEERLGYWG